MKSFKTIAALVLCIGFLFSVTSCVVFVKKDNGEHKGWYKNTNNPHNPHSTKPEKDNDKHEK
jgi:hypothetical protein